ncbi:RuBisCO large subunit C-terminal-like domain-containing protein [Devosia submarina]|uniref:RuBisCO large subunit C-terminal-like domain-containing protein n=1 Tax=Devosia submarina TaxID=1173082 RepID=UPI001FE4FD2E|nr:RuBisCO large subunit C-terminal-like domain-containing protein [Devosia submarina]
MARFSVTYWLGAAEATEALQRAGDVALEQTVEIPRDIVPAGYVEDEILGRVEDVRPASDGRGGFFADISYSDDDVGGDFLQLLNVVFGNSALKTETRVEAMTLTEAIGAICPGPQYGNAGLRQRTGQSSGPILMSAIKPVGLSTRELADLAHQFALGGMDMIKDDHGLANQDTSPFPERLKACVEAVGEANRKSGHNAIYVPNITGPANQVLDNAFEAQEAGAGAVMLAPALVGLDVARRLSADPSFTLPIVSHPTFGGANIITPTTGFSHGFYFGLLSRLMGVDAVVYPNFGGRFGFSKVECRSIADHCSMPFGSLKPILPAPGGGMKLESVPAMREVYGNDVIYLVGGALLREKSDLPGACRRLIEAVRP